MLVGVKNHNISTKGTQSQIKAFHQKKINARWGQVNHNVINVRFYWIRIIKKNNSLIGNFEGDWHKVVNRTPVGKVKELALTVYGFPLFIKNQWLCEGSQSL